MVWGDAQQRQLIENKNTVLLLVKNWVPQRKKSFSLNCLIYGLRGGLRGGQFALRLPPTCDQFATIIPRAINK